MNHNDGYWYKILLKSFPEKNKNHKQNNNWENLQQKKDN